MTRQSRFLCATRIGFEYDVCTVARVIMQIHVRLFIYYLIMFQFVTESKSNFPVNIASGTANRFSYTQKTATRRKRGAGATLM